MVGRMGEWSEVGEVGGEDGRILSTYDEVVVFLLDGARVCVTLAPPAFSLVAVPGFGQGRKRERRESREKEANKGREEAEEEEQSAGRCVRCVYRGRTVATPARCSLSCSLDDVAISAVTRATLDLFPRSLRARIQSARSGDHSLTRREGKKGIWRRMFTGK